MQNSRLLSHSWVKGFGSKVTIAKLASNAVAEGKNGYVYVYFSNETEEIVFFDNFKLSQERGRILEKFSEAEFAHSIEK